MENYLGMLSEVFSKFVSIEESLEKAKFIEKKLEEKDFELIVRRTRKY